MDKTQVIAGVASDLYASEKAIDAAIAQATAMLQTMMAARTELDLSAVAFTESQAKAMQTLVALGAARDAIVSCHGELQKDHRRMGWGVFASGPLNKPADGDQPYGTRGHLRVA